MTEKIIFGIHIASMGLRSPFNENCEENWRNSI